MKVSWLLKQKQQSKSGLEATNYWKWIYLTLKCLPSSIVNNNISPQTKVCALLSCLGYALSAQQQQAYNYDNYDTAPYNPQPYQPQHNQYQQYQQQPDQYEPAPYKPAPAPYKPAKAPYQPAPAPYKPLKAVHPAHYQEEEEEKYPPQPFSYEYGGADSSGRHFAKTETSDDDGVVRGEWQDYLIMITIIFIDHNYQLSKSQQSPKNPWSYSYMEMFLKLMLG